MWAVLDAPVRGGRGGGGGGGLAGAVPGAEGPGLAVEGLSFRYWLPRGLQPWTSTSLEKGDLGSRLEGLSGGGSDEKLGHRAI